MKPILTRPEDVADGDGSGGGCGEPCADFVVDEGWQVEQVG